ncbi:SRPBCC family protein [Tenacibaculum soleae]|uniref:SRPBCC family protein n=1 Tax=Tenacibaculum soleae TaxID=447689 RepID=UPI0026E39459|nr:SRPBCC family protein [Tenacibaculum soleae]MDO6812139.1 SRPBCC family protein [Tenacibaculum soleae]
MKTVKIVLGIVTALVVVFLLTGIVVTEVKYTVEIEVDKPIEEVFKKFEDTDLMKQWLPDVKSIEILEEKPGKVGSTYTMVVENNGQEIKMIEKITAYIPNKKITFQFHSDQMVKTDDYNFIANGNTTKIVQNCGVNSKSYMSACMFPYFKGTFKSLSLNYMNQFKKIAEK